MFLLGYSSNPSSTSPATITTTSPFNISTNALTPGTNTIDYFLPLPLQIGTSVDWPKWNQFSTY